MKIGLGISNFYCKMYSLYICSIAVTALLSLQVSCSSKICFASSLLHSSQTATSFMLLAALAYNILSIATSKIMNNGLVPSTQM